MAVFPREPFLKFCFPAMANRWCELVTRVLNLPCSSNEQSVMALSRRGVWLSPVEMCRIDIPLLLLVKVVSGLATHVS